MAGDWIKIEKSTPDKPEVYLLAELLNLDVDAVVGKLVRAWAWIDGHLYEPEAPTVASRIIDNTVGVPGFCNALESVGWMRSNESKIEIVNYELHLSAGAKKRSLDARRKQSTRTKASDLATDMSVPKADKCPDQKRTKSGQVSGSQADNRRNREEKRREEKNISISIVSDDSERAPWEDEPKQKSKRFTPPSLEEVVAFFQEKNTSHDPGAYFDFYESNGWKVGKNKMSNWKSAASGWIRRHDEELRQKQPIAQPIKPRPFSED